MNLGRSKRRFTGPPLPGKVFLFLAGGGAMQGRDELFSHWPHLNITQPNLGLENN